MSNSPMQPGPEEEWNALVRQLHQQPKAQPQPFFYTRVQARLAARTAVAGFWLPSWARRPAYVALLGALVLAVRGDGGTLRPAPTSRYTIYQIAQPVLPH